MPPRSFDLSCRSLSARRSPLIAVQVMQALVREARMREQTHLIQTEVRRLPEDVERLSDRVGKPDAYFRQAQEDMATITGSAKKVMKRRERIDQIDFAELQPVELLTPGALKAVE
jgi:DNA recombination protein RmuC